MLETLMSNLRERMSRVRVSPYSLFFSLSAACLALSGCTFVDPNEPPPPDACVKQFKGAPESRLWAIVDGPPACSTTNPARPEGDDTLIHYTGGAWNADAALCRALDIFLGATPITDPDINPMDGIPDVTIERNFEVPLDAIGYCIVNKGTASEMVIYSTCGIQSAGLGACEQTLVGAPKADNITAEWFNCPGGPACAPKSDDACLQEAGDGKGYAGYVDDPDFFCTGTDREGELTDAQDSMLVVTGTRYKRASAICVGSSPYDSKAGQAFGMGPLSRLSTRDMATGLPVLDPARNPVPNGQAKGYCLFNKGLAEEYVLYSLCDGLEPADPSDTDAGATAGKPDVKPEVDTPAERCPGYKSVQDGDAGTKQVSVWGVKVPSPRAGIWFDCPGGEFCNLPTK